VGKHLDQVAPPPSFLNIILKGSNKKPKQEGGLSVIFAADAGRYQSWKEARAKNKVAFRVQPSMIAISYPS
jgi:hypothetical protein